jgi:hypothetical protein
MSSIFPYTQTEIYENPDKIKELYKTYNTLLRDLMKETIKITNILQYVNPYDKTRNENLDPVIDNYRINVNRKLNEISFLQDQLQSAPTIPELETGKINEINEINGQTRKLLDEIKILNENIGDIRQDISKENKNIDSNLQVELNNIQNKIAVSKNRNQGLLDDEYYKKYIHDKSLVKQKDINRMDLNNNKTYDTIIYNMKEDKKQKELSNNKKRLQFKTDKIERQTGDVKYNLNKTDRLKTADASLKALDELEKQFTENSIPANNKIENFSNIDEYKIQYLSPDYKKIMLSDASCNELDPGFNESLNCNDSNYNKNDENIKNCMQRAWCEYRGLNTTLHDNQTQSSEDKERYQDANEYYNLAVVDSINLTIGIFGVVFLILKNRNII